MPSDGSQPSTDDAETLFDEFLALAEESGEVDFESFVARHPGQERVLRELYERWSRLDARLESVLPGPVEDLTASRGLRDLGEPAASMFDAQPGKVLGDFRLIARLGRGGMGEVWEAEQLSLRRRVALKLVRKDRRSAGAARRSNHEARAGGRLSHPGVVAVYAAGEVQGVPYIAQELVGEGFSLADLIARWRALPRRGPEDYRRIARLFVGIAEAVHAAHEAGILHRDLKPQNILIGPDDRPRVSDFGLAHDVGQEGEGVPAGLVGTYPYMSPEQASGREQALDRRSDVFALGAVLYEALTLRRAFEGDTGPQILERVIAADPPDPRAIRSQVPRDLAVICLEALKKHRANRYPSMRALADDLKRFLGDEPIRARPPGALSRAVKWMRRHPAWTTAIASVSLALLAISALLLREVELRRDAVRQSDRADLNAAAAEQQATLAERQALEARRQAYLANIRAADLDLDRGNHVEARHRLAACAPGLRGWEWRHDMLRADSSLLQLSGHPDAVLAVAASADGRRLATACADGVVRLWDGESGALLAELHGHVGPVRAVALARGGGLVLTGGDDATLRLWDGETGVPLRCLSGHQGPVLAVAASEDGQRLVSGSEDRTARLWDGLSGASVVLTGSNGAVVSVALSPDGRHLVTGSRYGSMFVWDGWTGELLFPYEWSTRNHVLVAVDASGDTVASGADDGSLLVWDTLTGAPLPPWDTPADEPPRTPGGGRFSVGALALGADRRRLVVVSPEDNTIEVFNGRSGERTALLTGQDRRPTSVALSRDGRRIVVGGTDGRALVWDADTGGASLPLQPLDRTAVTALAASARGATVAAASVQDRVVGVWDGTTGALRLRLEGHAIGVTAVAVSADGRRVVSGAYDGTARLWDGTDGRPLGVLTGHGSGVTSVACSADGSRVVTSSHDRTVRVWDAEASRPLSVLAGLEAVVTSLAMSADGRRVAAGSEDGSVRVWDWALGPEVVCELRAGQGLDDGTVALSSDGRTLAWGSLREDSVQLWNADTGEALVSLSGYRNGVTAVALASDGSRVVTASARDDVLRLWDGHTGDPLVELGGLGSPVTSVVMTDDGKRILAGAADGSLRVWESELDSALGLWRGAAARR